MSKKLLSVLLVVAMLLALCACGNTAPAEEPTQEETTTSETEETADTTETEETAFPEVLTDTDLTIAEGLPTVRFDGTWKKSENDIQSEDFESLGLYMNQDPESSDIAVGFYSWEKTEATLVDEAKYALEWDYPRQASTKVYEGTQWFEPDDFNYVYYCAFDEKTFEDYTYCQAYFFEIDNVIYEYDYYVATEAIPMYDGLQFFGPKCTEVLELDEDYIDDGIIAARHCADGEFCDFDLYVFDKADDTIETMTQWFYDTKDNVVSVEPYTFTSRLGNEYEGVYVEYEDTYNDIKYYNATALELIGDKFIAIDCYAPLENPEDGFTDRDYAMESAYSMSYAFIGY